MRRANVDPDATATPGTAVRDAARLTGAELKALAVATAREAGAASLAVTSARPDSEGAARMRASFARGDLATWDYDDEYAATANDPAAILAGARSLLCVAVPYAKPSPRRSGPLAGRVSNYAWSTDYHAAVRRILQRVADALDAAAQAGLTRVVCDTAPLAERAFAARAGLGWVGKHTNLIAPALGSFIFLGEIVTTLELPPDEPLKKTCGACARCVAVCPTGALRGDYTIDATRCISDLTQRKDALPHALRPLVGDWVWGCDLCQIACPPTRRATPDVAAEFAARDAAAAFPALLELLELRGSAFERRFRKTAMGWRGAAVLRRNAAVALGNALDRAAVPALERALARDPHPLVRGHAAWALGRIGSPRAFGALRDRAACEPEHTVVAEIEAALSEERNLRYRNGVEALEEIAR